MTEGAETPLRQDPALPPTVEQVLNCLMGYGPEKIILFGSTARGDTDEYSDLDLIVIKKTDKRFVERLVEAGSFIPLDLSVDVFVYTPEEFQSMIEEGNPFIEEALKDGKVLYEKTAGGQGREVAASWQHPVQKGRAFVKKPLETARRWLAQAEHSLGMTRLLLQGGFWAGACFHAEQTAQLALKAFLYGVGRRFINIHSVRELAAQCSKDDSEFSPFVDYGTFLDRYYLATRYPDALPDPAVPFESFTEQEAQQALAFATEMVELVRGKVPSTSPGPGA
jgi:HEPN domain-containing protein/predicted nucleotidyltransferase